MPVLSVEFEFPFGFSATPWNRHVNTGPAEVIPSGWRIGRAAIASWGLLGGEAFMPTARLEAALSLLTGSPYWSIPGRQDLAVPAYQPRSVKKPEPKEQKAVEAGEVPSMRTLHYERSVMFDGSLVACWVRDVVDRAAFTDLRTLLESLDYFGRSTSLCRIGVSVEEEGGIDIDSFPAVPVAALGEWLPEGQVHLTLNIAAEQDGGLFGRLAKTTQEAGQRPAGSHWEPYLLRGSDDDV